MIARAARGRGHGLESEGNFNHSLDGYPESDNMYAASASGRSYTRQYRTNTLTKMVDTHGEQVMPVSEIGEDESEFQTLKKDFTELLLPIPTVVIKYNNSDAPSRFQIERKSLLTKVISSFPK